MAFHSTETPEVGHKFEILCYKGKKVSPLAQTLCLPFLLPCLQRVFLQCEEVLVVQDAGKKKVTCFVTFARWAQHGTSPPGRINHSTEYYVGVPHVFREKKDCSHSSVRNEQKTRSISRVPV